jgi:hypothetical protein
MRLSTAGGGRPKAPAGLSYGRGRTKRSDDGRSWLGSTPGGAGLRGLTEVAVVPAADFGKLHDLPRRRQLDRPEVGCVLVESEVAARLMVIGKVSGQDAAKVSLAEDEHVTQALAPDRPDEALRERILPGAVWRREDLVNPHGRHPVPELLAIDLVTISEEVRRRGLVREGVHELLSRPGGGGMLGDVEVDGT